MAEAQKSDPKRELWEELSKADPSTLTDEEALLAYKLGKEFGDVGQDNIPTEEQQKEYPLEDILGNQVGAGLLTEGGYGALASAYKTATTPGGSLMKSASSPEALQAGEQAKSELLTKLEEQQKQNPVVSTMARAAGSAPIAAFQPETAIGRIGYNTAIAGGYGALDVAGRGGTQDQINEAGKESAIRGLEISAGLEFAGKSIPWAASAATESGRKTLGTLLKGPNWEAFDAFSNPATRKEIQSAGSLDTVKQYLDDQVNTLKENVSSAKSSLDEAKSSLKEIESEWKQNKRLESRELSQKISEGRKQLEIAHKSMLDNLKEDAIFHPEVANEIVSSINTLKDRVKAGSKQSYKILETPEAKQQRIIIDPIVKRFNAARKQLPIQGVYFPMAGKTEEILSYWQSKFDSLPKGSVSMSEGKKILQELDDKIDWDKRAGEMTPMAEGILRQVRGSMRRTIGDLVPEFDKLMVNEVAPNSALLSQARELFPDIPTTRAKLETLHSAKNIDTINVLNELDKVAPGFYMKPIENVLKLKDKLGRPSSLAIQKQLLPEYKNLQSSIEQKSAFDRMDQNAAKQAFLSGTPEYQAIPRAQNALEQAKANLSPVSNITPFNSADFVNSALAGKVSPDRIAAISKVFGSDFQKMAMSSFNKEEMQKDLYIMLPFLKDAGLNILTPGGVQKAAMAYGGAKAMASKLGVAIKKISPIARTAFIREMTKSVALSQLSNTEKAVIMTDVNKHASENGTDEAPEPQPSPTPQRSPQSMAPSLDDVTNFIQNRKKEDF